MTFLSKRLKKRIQEVCGLTNLSRDDKVRKARLILDNLEEKQRICNELLGTSFKDIEQTLQEIIDSKKFSTKEQRVEQELLHEVPEKIHGYVKSTPTTALILEYLLDKEEVRLLIEASSAPYVDPLETIPSVNYATFSPEEVSNLVDGNYDHTRFTK